MADDENKIRKWIRKWKKDKGDIGAVEENPQIIGPEEKLRGGTDKGDIGAVEENPQIIGPEEKLRGGEKNLREAKENFQEDAAKVDVDARSDDIMPPPKNTLEQKAAEVKRYKEYPKIVEKGRASLNVLPHKPIVITLVIVAIVLGGFLLYSQMQLSNQSYKIENFNANWNQSLADLRSGNTSIVEYCNNRVHDEDLCNRFINLQYMN